MTPACSSGTAPRLQAEDSKWQLSAWQWSAKIYWGFKPLVRGSWLLCQWLQQPLPDVPGAAPLTHLCNLPRGSWAVTPAQGTSTRGGCARAPEGGSRCLWDSASVQDRHGWSCPSCWQEKCFHGKSLASARCKKRCILAMSCQPNAL